MGNRCGQRKVMDLACTEHTDGTKHRIYLRGQSEIRTVDHPQQSCSQRRILTDDQRDFTYYNISVGYNALPGEGFVGSKYAFNSTLYLIAGVGNTEFADDSNFTINVGVGYRFLFNDWIALRLDARDYIFDSDLLGTDKTTHNLEATAGLSVFF